MNQNQFRKFSNIIQYRNVTALEEMLVTDLEVNSLFRCSTECEPSVDRTLRNMAVCALWMQGIEILVRGGADLEKPDYEVNSYS